jgi:hypothetical protein
MLNLKSKMNCNKFIGVSGLGRHSIFAIKKKFGDREMNLKSWDILMKNEKVYDKTPSNIANMLKNLANNPKEENNKE